MKSMNKSFLGASIILAVLSGCASKQAQQPELTLSGLNPANFEVSTENAKPIQIILLKIPIENFLQPAQLIDLLCREFIGIEK